jgi:protein SCO1/2
MSIVLSGVPTAVRAAEPFHLMQWPTAAPKPRFDLIDVDHRRRNAADFRGRVIVVFFGFTHCPDVCPDELFKMAHIVKRLGSMASHVRVLFITLDPEHDTPELLKSYVAAFDPHFIGLTGSTADVNAAASSFSVQFAKVPQGKDYTISHSTGTYVLDKTGRLRLAGTMQTSADDWVHDLLLLAAARR